MAGKTAMQRVLEIRVTAAELANQIGVSKREVLDWRKLGLIDPGHRYGGYQLWRVDQAERIVPLARLVRQEANRLLEVMGSSCPACGQHISRPGCRWDEKDEVVYLPHLLRCRSVWAQCRHRPTPPEPVPTYQDLLSHAKQVIDGERSAQTWLDKLQRRNDRVGVLRAELAELLGKEQKG